jgi:hypothetical protein
MKPATGPKQPAISYDFQAAIGESGLPAPSYYQAKKLNYFLNEFGTDPGVNGTISFQPIKTAFNML